ncbi:hypothetical protein HK098_007467 [Nowakowskiella sp. JEL0407]|nr:hypothetical protein HK098_007467 [Nowakowskiella sp. JEL0407]
MTGVKFITKTALPSTGPKKKIPYIRVHSETVPDSQLCIWHLQKIKLPGYTDIDANLSSNQRILLESVRLLMEEIIYRQTAWERWANPANHYGTKSSIMTVIKNPIMKYILFHRVSKHNTEALHMHGFGRFSRVEQQMFSKRAVDTISELLGDSQYILGPQPCSLDATVYAHMVDAIKSCEIWPDMPTGAYIKTKRNIMNYVDRMTKQYYPELLE